MKPNLFFCGDSVTFGMELEPNHESLRFSHLVATDSKLSYHNISKSGACNDWIVKTAISYFREGHTCDTAIIQFSAPERWIYFDPTKSEIYNGVILKRGEVWRNIGNAKTTNNLKSQAMADAHSAYYKYIYTEQLAIENYWKNVFLIDSYLKDKCKTIYLTLGYPVEKNDWTTDVEIGSVKEIVRESILVGHPSPEGHRKIADYILKRM